MTPDVYCPCGCRERYYNDTGEQRCCMCREILPGNCTSCTTSGPYLRDEDWKGKGTILEFVMNNALNFLNPPKECKCDFFDGCVYRADGEESYRCTICNDVIKNPIGCYKCVGDGGKWWIGERIPDPRPRCARCNGNLFALDTESVCPVCRKSEVERDDGC